MPQQKFEISSGNLSVCVLADNHEDALRIAFDACTEGTMLGQWAAVRMLKSDGSRGHKGDLALHYALTELYLSLGHATVANEPKDE